MNSMSCVLSGKRKVSPSHGTESKRNTLLALGKGCHSCHLNTHTVACNGGKHTRAQAPLKGNEGVGGTGTSDCRHSHTDGSRRHSPAPISSCETGKPPGPHTPNHPWGPTSAQCICHPLHGGRAPAGLPGLRATHMAGDALGTEGGIHLVPGCCMEVEEAKAQLVLHVRRRPERTCPWGYLAGAACRDYTALGHWLISILCLHRSDSEQGQAQDTAVSPDNPRVQDMSPHVSPCKTQRPLCKLCLLPLLQPVFCCAASAGTQKAQDLRNQLNYGNWVENTFNPGGSRGAGDMDVP